MPIIKGLLHIDDTLCYKIIEDYKSGLSALACAVKHLGAQHRRDSVKKLLKLNGIEVRNGSQANIIRFQNATPEERKAITQAANVAKKGKAEPEEQRIKFAIARSKSLKGHHIGIGENEFADFLTSKGIDFTRQFPLNRYNIDFFLWDSIAVEIRCSAGNAFLIPTQRKKIEYLLNRHTSVIYVAFSSLDAFIGNFENVVANIQEVRGLPSGLCQYRMISCGSERYTRFRNELGQFSCELAPKTTYNVRVQTY